MLLVVVQEHIKRIPHLNCVSGGVVHIGEFSYRSDVAFILRNPMSLDVGGCQRDILDAASSEISEKRRYFMMGNALVTKVINRIEPVLDKIISNE